MTTGIYIISNKINGKCYIGSSINIQHRWSKHRYMLKNGTHPNPILQNTWNKYGYSIFKYDIIEICSRDNLIIREQYYLDSLKPEYNISTNATAPMTGRTHTVETKNKLSITSKSHKWSDSQRLMMSNIMKGNNYGLKNKGKKRKPLTEEHKRKLSIKKIGNQNNKGWKFGPCSEERKMRISKANKGRRQSEECKRKISISHTGSHWFIDNNGVYVYVPPNWCSKESQSD